MSGCVTIRDNPLSLCSQWGSCYVDNPRDSISHLCIRQDKYHQRSVSIYINIYIPIYITFLRGYYGAINGFIMDSPDNPDDPNKP